MGVDVRVFRMVKNVDLMLRRAFILMSVVRKSASVNFEAEG